MTEAPYAPLLTPDQAAALLDQLLYEQVLDCVDLDALYQVEQSLVVLVGELDGVPIEQVGDIARAMLDRVLARLPDDARRYLRTAALLSIDGCGLCAGEPDPRGAPRA